MRCTICQQEIEDDAVMVMLYVAGADAPQGPMEFTGIAWDMECAATHALARDAKILTDAACAFAKEHP